MTDDVEGPPSVGKYGLFVAADIPPLESEIVAAYVLPLSYAYYVGEMSLTRIHDICVPVVPRSYPWLMVMRVP